jgi:hypothetical protein
MERAKQKRGVIYVRVLSAHANTPQSLYRWTMYDLILQQAIEYFDPGRQGMSVSVVRCVSPLRLTFLQKPTWSHSNDMLICWH